MFEKVKDAFHAQNRGGYRQWFNPLYADPNKNTRLQPTKTNAMLFDEDKDEDEEDMVPRDDDDDDNEETEIRNMEDDNQETREADGGTGAKDDNHDNDVEAALRNVASRLPSKAASRAPSKAASRAPSAMPQSAEDQHKKHPVRLRNVGDIQVLNLHSDNPIISYKGRIFSGSWASNIGTELIFGSHDEVADRGLPYLRTVAGNVDLMAASSVRILTTPADMRPKTRGGPPAVLPNQQNRKPAPDRYRQLRKESKIEIPVAFDKHGRRKPQARFLENLMALKRSRGEMDEATTMTKDTTRDFVDQEDDPEEASLQKKRARDRRRQQRLMVERANKPKVKRIGGNRWVKPPVVSFTEKDDRGDPGAPGGGDGDGGANGNGNGNGDADADAENGLSTKTPATWAGLDIARDASGKAADDTVMDLD